MSDSQLVIREPRGTITVTRGVLEQVVQRAAEEEDGVRVRRPRRGLEVVVDGGSARVSLELAVRFDVVIRDAAEGVQQRVAERLRTICGLEADAVDVSVEEVE